MRASGAWAGLTASIAGIAQVDIDELDARGLAEELRDITAAQNLLETERIRRVARLDDLDGARVLGHRTSAAFLTFDLGLEPGAAAERVRLARQRGVLGATIGAMAGGEIRYEQAAIISNAAAMLDKRNAPTLEGRVLPEARKGMDPVRLRDFAKRVADEIDSRVLRGDATRAQRARYLAIGPDRDGIAHIQGRMDIELSAYLRALLDGKLGPPQKDDERTPGQRRHDALKGCCREMLQGGVKLQRRHGRAVRPILTATEQKWNTGVGPAVLLNHRTPIDLETARAMAVGVKPRRAAALTPGNPRARSFSAAQREAMEDGVGYCEWAGGCGQPAEWCEGNHIVRYADGGPTTESNGNIHCRFHNQLLEKGWAVAVDADGRRRALPPEDPMNPGRVAAEFVEASGAGPPQPNAGTEIRAG